MLQDMTRTISIGLAHSTPVASTTGVPEGCGMSVVAMAVITWWQASVILHDHVEVRPVAYADNWNLVAPTVRTFLVSTETLLHFVLTLRLTISPQKSWVWSTNAAGRRQLKNFRINGVVLPVVCNIADLGCDINYSRRTRKSKMKTRWSNVRKKCSRIQISCVPRTFKHRMVQSIGFQGATYGTNLQHVTKTQWSSLRANLAHAIQLSRAGASSWLALGMFRSDPQKRHLQTCLRFWRRFGHICPDISQLFMNSLLQDGVSNAGPAACLKRTLKAAGWSIDGPQHIKHESFGFSLNWLECARGFLNFAIEYAWSKCVIKAVAHRKDWDGVSLGCHSFHTSISKMGLRDAWIIRAFASGKHYTNNIILKYQKDVSPICPCCNQVDGKEHRLYHCKGLTAVRRPYGDLLRRAKALGKTFVCYGIPPHPGDIRQIAPNCFREGCPIVHPPADNKIRHLFVDGSAFGQDNPHTTVGSWAVVESGYLKPDFHLVRSGFIPSYHHNSYRGEISAVVFAMQEMYRGFIYTDCEAVVTVFSQLEDFAAQGKPMPDVDHLDLWKLVWESLKHRPPKSCQVVKVKAHLDASQALTDSDRWLIHGNNCADKFAKAVVLNHPVHKKVVHLLGKHSRIANLTNEYHTYVCLIANTIMDMQAKTKKCDKQIHKDMAQVPSFEPFGVQGCTGQVILPDFCNLDVDFPYGELYYTRFKQWLGQVRWPEHPCCDGPGSYVALLELYSDFVVSTKTETPIHKRDDKGGHVYLLLDQNPLLQLDKVNLSVHTEIWHHTWDWVFKHFPDRCCFEWTDKRVLNHLGAAFNKRPALVGGLAAYTALWHFFHQPGGRRRTLGYPFRPAFSGQ